jgi:hypothetical protein
MREVWLAYESPWERLSDAVERVMAATGVSRDQARADICRAIADGAVKIRCKLKKHRTRHFTAADTVLKGTDFQIPTDLKSQDLDWENSRPLKAWSIPHGTNRIWGDWELEWIEVFRTSVEKVLCQSGELGVPNQHARKADAPPRKRPAFERAADAIRHLYPDGVPTQAAVPNAILCRRVGEILKERKQEHVSDDTILRAAGRRRK